MTTSRREEGEVEAAWAEELEQRARDVLDGSTATVSADEFRRSGEALLAEGMDTYRQHALAAIKAGLDSADAGRVIPHEQVKAELRRKWLERDE